jgi:uncharacterized Zn finger protein
MYNIINYLNGDEKMGIINSASSASLWKGIDYYKNNHVLSYKKINNKEYIGKVKGSNNEIYDVYLNLDKPKMSSCNCKFANDRKIICKHILSLYFTLFPNEVKKIEKEAEIAEKEYEYYQEKFIKNLIQG